MDPQTIYEKWRQNRSQVDPAPDFAARVMQAVNTQAAPCEIAPVHRPSLGLLRAGACAAAVVAALFRLVELFHLFAASNLEN